MCEYTQDYADEPHGIICAEIDGENVLIDVDEYTEGYEIDQHRCPCPNCDLSRHVEYMIDCGLLDRKHAPNYRTSKAMVVAQRVAANEALSNRGAVVR